MRFVDTNILLYAVSSHPGEAVKAERATQILNVSDLALSVQVLQEFYVQATRDSSPTQVSHENAVAFLRTLERYPIQPVTTEIVHRAFASKRRWQLSYWDAAIIECGRALGCGVVLSEDLQHGQDFDGVRVLNPFLA